MIAIIGFGNHVKKNILPALERLGTSVKYIFVRDLDKVSGERHDVHFVDDLKIILDDIEVQYVYIATPISTHYFYAKRAIKSSKHVICEKPVTVNVDELNELYALSASYAVNLQQVIMYKYHRAYEYVRGIIRSNAYGTLKQISASFKIPHLGNDNIRYNKQLCGGALYDVGFYPISFLVSLLREVKGVESIVRSEAGFDVDLSGAAILESDKIVGLAQWAIGSCYENIIILDFENARISIERFFSKPETYNVVATIVDSMGNNNVVTIGKDDQFSNMFSQMISENDKSVNVAENKQIIQTIESIFSKSSVRD